MNSKLQGYIRSHFSKYSNATWASEAVTMTGEELFENEIFRELYKDTYLDTILYYTIEINSAISPFEIYKDKSLIALGYMSEETQNILYLEYDSKLLINIM